MITDTIFNNTNYTIEGDVKVTDVCVLNPDIYLKHEPLLFVSNDMHNGISFARSRYSDKFYYYTNDYIIGRSIGTYGEYTQLEIELLRNFINNDTIVYDIGANIGYHALAFSKLCRYVYAFEPNKKHLKLLRKNLEDRKNVEIFDNAISDMVGDIKIQDFDTDVPGNYGELYVNQDGYDVLAIRIDDLDIIIPDLIKIDVEGHELQVLRGSIETIREYNPIIFYEAHGSELAEIYDLLTEQKYHLYWYPCPNYNGNNYNKVKHNIFGNGGVVNILALPEKHKKVSNMMSVSDRDDTVQKAWQRFQSMQ